MWPLGCHSGVVNVEARPIDTAVFTRRCVLARLRELTLDKFKEMVSQNAAALLVLLPKDLESLEQQDKEVHIHIILILKTCMWFIYIPAVV